MTSKFNCAYWITDGKNSTFEQKEELKKMKAYFDFRFRCWRINAIHPDDHKFNRIKLLGLNLQAIPGTETLRL